MKLFNKRKIILEFLKDIEKEFKDIFVVGGIIRDLLIMKDLQPILDLDLIIKDLNIEKLKNFLEKRKLPFIILDEKNKIYRTVLKSNQHLLVTIDISSYHNLEEDVLRRDFTINALCIELRWFIEFLKEKNKTFLTKKLIDIVDGVKDIKKKIIKTIKEENLKEDPIRILRAARFMCYGFRIDKLTEKLCILYKKFLKNVAKERIYEEIKKIFLSNTSYKILEWLDKTNIIEEIIPEIKILKTKGKNTQFRKFYFHPQGLWQHVKLTFKEVEKVLAKIKIYYPKDWENIKKDISKNFYLLKIVALLHDLAKPFVAKKEKDKVRFFHHEIKSAEFAEKILKSLKFNNEEIKIVTEIIKNHMRLGSLFNNFNALTERAYLRLFRETENFLYLLLIFCLADRLSYEVIPIRERKKYFRNFQSIKSFIKFENLILEKYKQYKFRNSLPRLINGYDVMKYLKIKEGPLVGKILKYVEEAQLLNKIKTKSEALKLAKEYYQKVKESFVEKV